MTHPPSHNGHSLPKAPINRLVAPIERFLHVEAAGGVVLLIAALAALVLANSALAPAFLGFWKTKIGFSIGSFEVVHSLKHWINDGLMTIFFFTIGLEVKREIVDGELRSARSAALPIAAALGGMIVPAAVYLAFQAGEAGARGWGIPMATDIAFVVGCMAILGSRLPRGLRVMLLSLAIVDDIGAILVIAVGYTDSIGVVALALGIGGLLFVLVMQRLGIRSVAVYAIVGTLIWFAFHESGVHATIAGVALGLMTPAKSLLGRSVFTGSMFRMERLLGGEGWDRVRDRNAMMDEMKVVARETVPPLERLESRLHPWVSFVIMPVFALANAGISFDSASPTDAVAVAVIAGLVIGKPLGITIFSALAVALRIGQLPAGVSWPALIGGGFLAGIGFTMAMFIAELAVEEPLLSAAKMGVLVASALAGIIGCALLVTTLKRPGDGVTQ